MPRMAGYIIFSLISVLLFAEASSVIHSNIRSPRSAWNLAKQVQCATTTKTKKPSLMSLLEGLMTYGCYCGLGGKGKPVDSIDACCQAHDNCYGKAVDGKKCWFWQPYFTLYGYSVSKCGTGEVKMTCEKQTGCADAICKCDQDLALCIKPVWHTYNTTYKEYQDSSYCTTTAKEIENAKKAKGQANKIKQNPNAIKKIEKKTKNKVKQVINAKKSPKQLHDKVKAKPNLPPTQQDNTKKTPNLKDPNKETHIEKINKVKPSDVKKTKN